MQLLGKKFKSLYVWKKNIIITSLSQIFLEILSLNIKCKKFKEKKIAIYNSFILILNNQLPSFTIDKCLCYCIISKASDTENKI